MVSEGMERTAASSPWVTHPWVAEGRGRVRFGIAYAFDSEWPALRDLAQEAEARGFDSYWTMDHPNDFRGCWTTLAALAVSTTAIRLGTLVTCVYYHSPAQIARGAADVDRLSDGRMILGLGVGDYAREFEQLGIPFSNLRTRQTALEETIQTILGLWGEQPFTFRGALGQVTEANVHPAPVQQPRVPILIAGGGEKVTLRQVAQYADMSNFAALSDAGSAFTLGDVSRKFAALERHCATLGRPFGSVARSFLSGHVLLADTRDAAQRKLRAAPEVHHDYWKTSAFVGTPRDGVDYYRTLIAAGAQYIIFVLHGYDLESMRLLADEVIPELNA